MKKHLVLAVILLAGWATFAQEAAKKEAPAGWPAGWTVRLDKSTAPAAEFKFAAMPPGWHITSGPAGIAYESSKTAKGNYRIESETFLFDPAEHLEGFGIFFGGKNLADDAQSYSYFLIRSDGRFLIKQRNGRATKEILPWTENAAIVKWEAAKNPVKNVLAIEAGAENVDFLVNGQKVASQPRAQLGAEGVVGLRINHHVNVHVTNLKVEAR